MKGTSTEVRGFGLQRFKSSLTHTLLSVLGGNSPLVFLFSKRKRKKEKFQACKGIFQRPCRLETGTVHAQSKKDCPWPPVSTHPGPPGSH